MIGLDTNVLVRYFAQDDARQSARASRLIESFTAQAPGYISIVTLAEMAWVLQGVYGRGRSELAAIVEALLQTDGLVAQLPALVRESLLAFESGRADFADHLIERLGAAAGCESTMTFDKAAVRDAGMRMVPATPA